MQRSMFCFPAVFLHRETILAVALFSLFEVGIVFCRLFVSLVNLCEASCFKHLFRSVGWLDRFCAQIRHLANPCITARLCESLGYARYYTSCLKPTMWTVYLKPSNCLNTTVGLPLGLLSFLSVHPIHRYATSDACPVWPRRRHLQPCPKRLQYFFSPDTSYARFHLLLPAKPPEQRLKGHVWIIPQLCVVWDDSLFRPCNPSVTAQQQISLELNL